MNARMSVAVSVPGRSGRACEDASAAHPSGDTIAVADGLGSAARSAEAAQAAVRLVLGPVRDALQAGLPADALPRWFAVLWRAEFEDAPDFSTTLLFAVRCRAYTVVARVGDGLVLLVGPDDAVQMADGRGAWGNETAALPGAHLDVLVVPNDTAVLLASDGVSDDLVPGTEGDLARRLLAAHAEIGDDGLRQQLHSWLQGWRTPGSHDDRSIALLAGGCP